MNTEGRKTELTEHELRQIVGGRAPIPVIDWEVSARYLYENDRYLSLPASMQEQYLYYLEIHEYDLIGDLIKQNLPEYGEDYPILRDAVNKSVIGYR